jgi:aryl-alcohol dehydrogenase-like predicted oxidoreductase
MRRRRLGSTGLEVSEIGFGAWQLGDDGAWSGMDDRTAHRLVDTAIDGGINLFDTAPNYASGNSERLLGEALRGKRQQVVLVSKFGHLPDGSKVLEILFNIFHQDVRRSFPLVRKRGAGTIAKVPLDSGWLTGRFNARSRFSGARGRWSEEEIARRAQLVDRLDWLTADGSELAHKAIGFLLSYEEVSCVIPGMRTVDQLQSNLKAAGHALAPEDRDKLKTFWDEITQNGERPLPW